MRIKTNSLRFKIMMLFSFVVVVLFFVISLVFFQGIDKVIRKTTENELKIIANETSNKIERFLFERYGDIRVLAINAILSNHNISQKEKKYFLDQVRIAYKTYDYILITDLSGNIIIQSGNFKSNIDIPEIIRNTKTHGIYVSDIDYRPKNEGILYSALLKDNQGEVVGIAIEKMNLAFVEEIVKSVRLGKKGFAYLTNESYQSLFKDSKTNDLLDYHKQKKKNVEYFNFKGDNYIHVISPIKRYPTQNTNWFLVIEEIENEAFAIIYKVWYFTLTVMFFSIVTVLLFGWMISNFITYPVKRLVEHTALLAKGERVENIVIDTKDEFGTLANSLNSIIQNLNMMVNQILETSGQAVSIKEIRDYFNRFSNEVSAGIITIDSIGKIGSINQTGQDITGLQASDLIGRSVDDNFSAGIQPIINLLKDSMKNGKIFVKHLVKIKKNFDQDITIIFSSSLQKDKAGKPIGYVGVFRESVEFLKFEQSVDRAKTLNSLGMMSAGIAHEIRNPLTSIKGYAQYIQSILEPGHELQKDIIIIINEVDRLNRIIDRFLNFARPKTPVMQSQNINQILTNTVQLLSKNKPENISIELQLSAIPNINADSEQIEQVLVNLILNAFQAITSEGFILIKTRYLPDNDMMEIEIEDNGEGIKTEDYDKIFEPFYSTKNKGSGLGLAISARIIQDHGGFIECIGSPSQGTKFIVKLPIKENSYEL